MASVKERRTGQPGAVCCYFFLTAFTLSGCGGNQVKYGADSPKPAPSSKPPSHPEAMVEPPSSAAVVPEKLPEPELIKEPEKNSEPEKKQEPEQKLTPRETTKKEVVVAPVKKPVVVKPSPTASPVVTVKKVETAMVEESKVQPEPVINKPEVSQTAQELPAEPSPPILAKLEPPKVSTIVPAERLTLTLDQLPYGVGDGWQLDRGSSPLTEGNSVCRVTKKLTGVDDGYDQATLTLALSASGVWFTSSSNIDMTYPGVGVRFEKGAGDELVAFSSQFSDVGAFLRIEPETLSPDTRSIHIMMGFWPTWPVTHTRDIAFTTSDFPRLRQALSACAKL